MQPHVLQTKIIRPTLKHLGLWSQDAEFILLGTCAQESTCGKYIQQKNNGPAKGMYQMEDIAHQDIWDVVINIEVPHSKPKRVKELRGKVEELMGNFPSEKDQLYTNLAYQTAMARLHYWRFWQPLPNARDITGMGEYWKKYYNTRKGKGTVEEFIKNYNILIAPYIQPK